MKIRLLNLPKLPKYGIVYTYHKDNKVTAKRQFINTKLTTMLQAHALIQSNHLEVDVNIPVAYIDDEGNDLGKKFAGLCRGY
jgi:hypothetical protein